MLSFSRLDLTPLWLSLRSPRSGSAVAPLGCWRPPRVQRWSRLRRTWRICPAARLCCRPTPGVPFGVFFRLVCNCCGARPIGMLLESLRVRSCSAARTVLKHLAVVSFPPDVPAALAAFEADHPSPRGARSLVADESQVAVPDLLPLPLPGLVAG